MRIVVCTAKVVKKLDDPLNSGTLKCGGNAEAVVAPSDSSYRDSLLRLETSGRVQHKLKQMLLLVTIRVLTRISTSLLRATRS